RVVRSVARFGSLATRSSASRTSMRVTVPGGRSTTSSCADASPTQPTASATTTASRRLCERTAQLLFHVPCFELGAAIQIEGKARRDEKRFEKQDDDCVRQRGHERKGGLPVAADETLEHALRLTRRRKPHRERRDGEDQRRHGESRRQVHVRSN